MKVLLADDHALFCEALKSMLTSNGIEVVGTASDGFEALSLARALHPEVVLMDIFMPRCTGMEATRLIKNELPDIKVVMLTMSADDADLFEAIKSGASGYILKSVMPQEFLDLLAGAFRDGVAISREMATRIIGKFALSVQREKAASAAQRNYAKHNKELTPRQIDILKRVAQGSTYKEIAKMQNLSERTVQYHMSEILNKLCLQNRAQAICYATSKGFIQDPDSELATH